VDNLCNYAINTGVLTRYNPSFSKKRSPTDTDLQHRKHGYPNFSKFRLVNSSPIVIDGGEMGSSTRYLRITFISERHTSSSANVSCTIHFRYLFRTQIICTISICNLFHGNVSHETDYRPYRLIILLDWIPVGRFVVGGLTTRAPHRITQICSTLEPGCQVWAPTISIYGTR